MLDLHLRFKTFMKDEEETTYELTYNGETYLIFVPHDGKFHNKKWECEKEVPEEVAHFISIVIDRELLEMSKE